MQIDISLWSLLIIAAIVIVIHFFNNEQDMKEKGKLTKDHIRFILKLIETSIPALETESNRLFLSCPGECAHGHYERYVPCNVSGNAHGYTQFWSELTPGLYWNSPVY